MTASKQPILTIAALQAWYRDIQVLYGIDLAATPGQVTVVLGPNGAGKTTLLLAVAGGVTARGEVRFRGRRIDKEPAWSRFMMGVALVQPQRRVFQGLTVEQNLQLVARHLPRRQRADAIEETLQKFPSVRAWLRKSAGDLSGGQQQMAGIAQALILRPGVLMLDEPSTGLAPQAVDALRDVIVQLKTGGLAVILVEQALSLAMALGDDITVLGRGRVLRQGPRASFSDDATSQALYLGLAEVPGRGRQPDKAPP